ncbi:hypothetical protein ACGFMO_04105 [Streptomyces niveus]|jgi:hypothetical protein|uniref:hypothetical protein n=1 Tax=Streptomyces niveus TaxID=193462 RepID=UPI003710A237
MSATESTGTRPSEPTTATATTTAHTTPDPSAVSMSDLLASCAAASAVSTPPPAEKAEPTDTGDDPV